MADERAGREIEIRSDADTTRGYLAVPASGRGRGVLVIQEWWGLVDHIRDVCDRFAREGFVALAPDVASAGGERQRAGRARSAAQPRGAAGGPGRPGPGPAELDRGETAEEPDAAGRLMMDLDIPRAARDLDGAVRALLSHDAVEGPKVGAVGFRMGGQLALYAATRSPRIGAVADFYGIHPDVTLDLSGLEAPVLGLFAENDTFVTSEAARKLEADLRDAGCRAHFEIYPGVGHAFFNDSRPDGYDAEAAARAWSEVLSFLRAELAS